ncbi:MAG: hypothetical protein JSV80_17735 [Acidobacteriota bacterium]|nr:MAG: hypothetical protein JSV80_17735 [Acidobacteriota bacterium]
MTITNAGSEHGMSLVEALVAELLLSIMALSLLAPMVTGAQINHRSSHDTVATLKMKDWLENVRRAPFDATELTAGGSVHSDVTGYYKNFEFHGNEVSDSSSEAQYVLRWAVVENVSTSHHVKQINAVFAARASATNQSERSLMRLSLLRFGISPPVTTSNSATRADTRPSRR